MPLRSARQDARAFDQTLSFDTSKVTTMSSMFFMFNRQSASAFNQPLSFDTSEVTTMDYMFAVRSARPLAPKSLESGLPRARRLRRHCPTASRLRARTSPRIACPSVRLGRARARLTRR